MKKLLCIILALTLVCAIFAGCGSNKKTPDNASSPDVQNEPGAEQTPGESAAPEPEKKRSVGFVILGMGNEFFEGIVNAYTEKFTAAGWDCSYVSGEFDVSTQIEAIENYTAMGVDVLIVFPVSGKAVSSAVEQARAAGIKVITMVEETSEWDGFLSSDNLTTGKANAWLCAQWVEEKYPDAEPGSIPVALIQVFDSETDALQSEGLEAITEYTDKVSVVRYEIQGQNTTDGLAAAENLYVSHSEIKLFVTTSNAVALGINSFYTGLNSPVDDLSDYGAWGTNASYEAIEAIFASKENRSILRGINIQAGYVETANDFLTLAEGLVNGTITKLEKPANVYLVTAENVDQWVAESWVPLQWDYENAVAVVREKNS